MSRFCISAGLRPSLTDYNQGKAIAQLPQVRHQVHQNQQLKEQQQDTQSHSVARSVGVSEQILCIIFRRTVGRCQTPNKGVGVSRYAPVGPCRAVIWDTPVPEGKECGWHGESASLCVMSHSGQVRVEPVRSAGAPRGLGRSPLTQYLKTLVLVGSLVNAGALPTPFDLKREKF